MRKGEREMRQPGSGIRGCHILAGVLFCFLSIGGCTFLTHESLGSRDSQHHRLDTLGGASHDPAKSVSSLRGAEALIHSLLRHGQYSDAAILRSLRMPWYPNPRSHSRSLQVILSHRHAGNHSASKKSELTADWHMQVGWALVLAGNYAGAEAAYRQAIRQDNQKAAAYLGLGMALMMRQEYQEAIEAYRRALTLRPEYPAALVHLGYAYTQQANDPDRWNKARLLFEKASQQGDPFAKLALLELQTRMHKHVA
ncbi:MAG: tetratricopeptide repeat protein [Nitrospirae bacterium]|nr:MAG: tetratricopeptide repeat protein [Nitrospirota bacterium]